MNFAKTIFIPLASLMFVLPSCQKTSKQQNPAPEHLHEIHVNLGTEPSSLDPRKATDIPSSLVLNMLFEGLTRLNPNGVIVASAAYKIDCSSDQKTYTFHLRNNSWSNQTPVTAYDFEYSWKKVLDPQFACEHAYQMYVIKNGKAVAEGEKPLDKVGVRALDEKTLRVELEHSTPYFLQLTATHLYFPVSRDVDQKQENWSNSASTDYLSNGPFRLKLWAHNNVIEVEKNPCYWDRNNVKLERISVEMVQDASTQLSMFQQGQLQWCGLPFYPLPSDALAALQKSKLLHVQPSTASMMYLFNTDRAPFDHPKMRLAFSYAIDRQAIVKYITQAGELPLQGLLPATIAFRTKPYFKDHNLMQARLLFAEALTEMDITKEQLPPITLSYNTVEIHHRVAQAAQQQWREAFEIDVQLENIEWKTYRNKLARGDFQIARLLWQASFSDPIHFLELFQYKSYGNNWTNWEDSQYAQYVEEAMAEPSPFKRRYLLKAAEKLLLQQMPFIPLYSLSNVYVKDKNLKNVYLSPLGQIDFKWAYIDPDVKTN